MDKNTTKNKGGKKDPTTNVASILAMLVFSIIIDVIGCASYLIPGLAESTDVVWAPISAFLLQVSLNVSYIKLRIFMVVLK